MASPSSLWIHDFEKNSYTPCNGFMKDFAMPEGVRRRLSAVNHDADIEPCTIDRYESPEKSTQSNLLKEQNSRTSSEEGISSHSSFVGLNEMDQIQYEKQRTDDQELEVSEGCAVEKTVKDVRMDPMQHPWESPSPWPLEFERKQKDIIELWHACHVSLVHRTCFFQLFKGDPADSIYMEVEHRRLSFLRTSCSLGSLDKIALGDSSNTTLASSMKDLRRERDMLRKQMLKRLSAQERERYYTEWGIALDSKQRRQQLSRRIWTETNIEHVRESASLVAKLIGLLEPGHALKEMFGLNFTPYLTNFKSYRRKNRGSTFM